MVLCEQTILEDTVEIYTTPEKIWEFRANMDDNYKVWHPQDHIFFDGPRGNQWKRVRKYMLRKLQVVDY